MLRVSPPLDAGPADAGTFGAHPNGAGGQTAGLTDTPDLLVAGRAEPRLVLLRAGQDSEWIADGEVRAAGISAGFADVLARDLNGDAVDDAVGSLPDAGLVLTVLGDAAEGLRLPQTIAVGGHPGRLAVGDVTGDSVADVLVITDAGVTILRGSGDGRLSADGMIATSTRPADILLANLSGTGAVDVAVALPDENRVQLFEGNGRGAFTAGIPHNSQRPVALATGQFTADAWADLVVAEQGVQRIATYRGAATGLLAESLVTQGIIADRLVAADVNHDRRLDLLALDVATGTVNVLLGTGDGRFDASVRIDAGSAVDGFAVADLDGDGLTDFALTTSEAANPVVIATNTTMPPRLPCVGDCDGSGHVSVSELVLTVQIALGLRPLTACSALEEHIDGTVTIDEVVIAVDHSLTGCNPGNSR